MESLAESELPKFHNGPSEPRQGCLRPIGTSGPQWSVANPRMEPSMSIKTKLAAVAVAALAATGSIASTTTSAEAHGIHPGWGLGAALLGTAIVGSAIAASTPYPY